MRVPVTYYPVATQRQFARNQRRIVDKPYAHYFNGDLWLSADVLPALRAPMQPRAALACTPEALNTLLDPGYHEVENGYCQLPDGGSYVASRVPMPGCSGEMYKWWFWWHSVESERYTLWYPHNHIACRPRDRSVLTEPGLSHEQRYVGTTHDVDEYIGPELVRISIRFLDPAELGFDTRRFAQAGIVGHACARVTLRGVNLQAVTMVHLARKTDDGIEQRSRYWIGHDVKLGSVSIDPFVSALRLKSRMSGAHVAYEQLHHDQIEFTHLATILPDLYREFA